MLFKLGVPLPTIDDPINPTWWKMHLVSVTLIFLASLAAIMWLTIDGKPIPEIFNVTSIGAGAYLFGTQANSVKDKMSSKNANSNTSGNAPNE